MSKVALLFTIALIPLVFINSCKDEIVSAPLNPAELRVQIYGNNAIIALEDEVKVVALDIRVSTTDGAAAQGVPVEVRVISGPGEVNPGNAITDRAGIVKALYFVTVPYAETTAILRSVISGDSTEYSLRITGLPIPVSIHFNSIPSTIESFYATPQYTDLNAIISDRRGLRMPGLLVGFTLVSGEGQIGVPIAITDSTGTAQSSIYTNGHWFGNMVLAATAFRQIENIQVGNGGVLSGKSLLLSLDGTPLTDTLVIPVHQLGTVSLEFITPDTAIYNYSNQDRLYIKAKLTSDAGRAVPGMTVNFRTHPELARITPAVLTDQFGVATSEFNITGIPGQAGIRVEYEPLGLCDSMTVTIKDRSPQKVELDLESRFVTRWADSSYRATVTVTSTDGEPLFHIPTRLSSLLGNSSTVVLTDTRGRAQHYYRPIRGGVEQLRAEAVGFSFSDAVEFKVYQLPMRPVATLQPVQIGGSHAFTYDIYILDANDIGVPGERIRFSITSGSLSSSEIVTDDNGAGSIDIFRGGSGIAELTMEWRGQVSYTEIQFPANRLAHMTIRLNPTTISARGTGALDTTAQIYFALFDEQGDTARGVERTVWLELIREPLPPTGCSINGKNSDSIHTTDGIGIATLFAGTQIGGKLIRGFTFRDETRLDTISAVLSTFAVVAGPPYSMDLNYDRNGFDAGGSAWSIEISALVYDSHLNPVKNGHIVAFTSYPDIVSITPGVTGNVGRNGRSSLGTAFTRMVYNSLNTFDTVKVTAVTNGVDKPVVASKVIVLPLQEGTLEISAEPVNLLIDYSRPDSIYSVRVWSVLRDGHNVILNNAPVIYTANRGRFYFYDEQRQQFIPFFPGIARGWTGQSVYLRGRADELIQDMEFEVNIQINSVVEGYPDVAADPVFVFLSWRR